MRSILAFIVLVAVARSIECQRWFTQLYRPNPDYVKIVVDFSNLKKNEYCSKAVARILVDGKEVKLDLMNAKRKIIDRGIHILYLKYGRKARRTIRGLKLDYEVSVYGGKHDKTSSVVPRRGGAKPGKRFSTRGARDHGKPRPPAYVGIYDIVLDHGRGILTLQAGGGWLQIGSRRVPVRVESFIGRRLVFSQLIGGLGGKMVAIRFQGYFLAGHGGGVLAGTTRQMGFTSGFYARKRARIRR